MRQIVFEKSALHLGWSRRQREVNSQMIGKGGLIRRVHRRLLSPQQERIGFSSHGLTERGNNRNKEETRR
jgi:hypothetical protein